MTKSHDSNVARLSRREAIMSVAGAIFVLLLALGGEGGLARLWAQATQAPTPAPAVIPPAPDPRFPQVPSWKTELRELAPNVYAYIQGGGPGIPNQSISNAGIVIGDDGVLVIDATAGPIHAKNFIAAVRKITDKPFRHLVNTHHHGDHVGGNQYFMPVEIVAHPYLREEMLKAAATAYLVGKKGDDHTIGIFTNTWVATPLTSKDSQYTVKDLTPLVRLILEPTIAVVNANSPYMNMNDFVEAAKKNPGSLKQAGGSVTAIESLTGLLIQRATGAKWSFISTPAVKDRIANILAGNVQIIIPQPQDVNEYIIAGKLRPIAALTEKRLAALPDVPTIKEQGISMSIIANARGFLAPPGISKEVVGFCEDFFAGLIRTASWKKYLEENQVENVFLNSRDLAPFLDEQITLMRSVLQEAGVKIER